MSIRGLTGINLRPGLQRLDAETFGTLLQHRHADHPFVAYRSSHDDLPEPLCALYLEGSEAIIRRFVDDGLKCPRKMLIRSDTLLLTQPNPGALDEALAHLCKVVRRANGVNALVIWIEMTCREETTFGIEM